MQERLTKYMKTTANTTWRILSNCGQLIFYLPPKTLILALLAAKQLPTVLAAKEVVAYLMTDDPINLRLTIHDPDAPTIGQEFYQLATALQQGKYCNITQGFDVGHYSTLYRYFFTILGDKIQTAELASNNNTQALQSVAVNCLNTLLTEVNTDEEISRDFFEGSMIIVGAGMGISLLLLAFFIYQICKKSGAQTTSNNDIELQSHNAAPPLYQSSYTGGYSTL